ncbi:MAG: hypothetical protein ACPGGK_04785 [Pikeienuella sp.]
MVKHNTNFHLSLDDVDLIETALRKKLSSKPAATVRAEDSEKARMVHDLLGRLHNQKVFYRPKDEIYVGG